MKEERSEILTYGVQCGERDSILMQVLEEALVTR
jgi:hypothetical protein